MAPGAIAQTEVGVSGWLKIIFLKLKESKSKYVVPVSQSATASNEDSRDHGENVVLPVTPEEVKS